MKSYRNITFTCCKLDSASTTSVMNGYSRMLHVHEYDDKYDVTGVNMLNASDPGFNLAQVPVILSTTQFKILVMNQYLNPAATLAIGNVTGYESVKTYGNLASQTDAATLLAGLPVYTPATITNLIYNLPLDAFFTKDWWGDGGAARAGLIPTQTGCVNKVDMTGLSIPPGPNGERHNGALTIQLIKAGTPAGALELNHSELKHHTITGDAGTDISLAERVKYGWRVKLADFNQYVLAEYTSFWHHPNGKCYGVIGWLQNPPQDLNSNAGGSPPICAKLSALVICY
jgi:hypothetical protein